MTAISNRYVSVLNDHKILYMPSCLIVEMLTKLYSQISSINVSGEPHHVAPDLVVLLQRMTENIDATAEAYRENRIRFFIGDWKEDKLKARRLFFNIMSRLGYIAELLGEHERLVLYNAIEDMTESWGELDRIMEDRSDVKCGRKSCDTCNYFRSYFRCNHPDNWKQVMANIILSLDEEAVYDEPGTYLILLCYRRLKLALMSAIENIERKMRKQRKFPEGKILYISNEEVNISCPKCNVMTESLKIGDTNAARQEYEKARSQRISLKRNHSAESLRGRYPMPPSLASMVRL